LLQLAAHTYARRDPVRFGHKLMHLNKQAMRVVKDEATIRVSRKPPAKFEMRCTFIIILLAHNHEMQHSATKRQPGQSGLHCHNPF
jgi:hypothetical protein